MRRLSARRLGWVGIEIVPPALAVHRRKGCFFFLLIDVVTTANQHTNGAAQLDVVIVLSAGGRIFFFPIFWGGGFPSLFHHRILACMPMMVRACYASINARAKVPTQSGVGDDLSER